MDEIEKVLEESSPISVAQVQEGDVQQQVPEPVTEQQEPSSPSNQHFKAVKQLKEKAERERDEALRRAAELETRLTGYQAPQVQPEEDYSINLGNDELVEGKHISKMDKKVDSKIKALEEKLKRYETQSSQSFVEAKLKMEYPDIEKVVTKENIEILSMQEPDIAATIQDSQDLYKKAVTAYKLIKKFGIQTDDNYHQDRVRAQENSSKPRPLTSIAPQQGNSPLSHANAFANGLTDELRAQLLKEMMEARR